METWFLTWENTLQYCYKYKTEQRKSHNGIFMMNVMQDRVSFMVTVTGDNIAGTSHGLDWHTVCYSSCTVGYQKGHQWAGH